MKSECSDSWAETGYRCAVLPYLLPKMLIIKLLGAAEKPALCWKSAVVSAALRWRGFQSFQGFQVVAFEGMFCISVLLWGALLFPMGPGGESKLSVLEELSGNLSLPGS